METNNDENSISTLDRKQWKRFNEEKRTRNAMNQRIQINDDDKMNISEC